jgi:hypothetical protein
VNAESQNGFCETNGNRLARVTGMETIGESAIIRYQSVDGRNRVSIVGGELAQKIRHQNQALELLQEIFSRYASDGLLSAQEQAKLSGMFGAVRQLQARVMEDVAAEIGRQKAPGSPDTSDTVRSPRRLEQVIQPSPTPAVNAGSISQIEDWIRRNNLNEYGDPQGTVYAGGNPLFDESTGKTRDRYEYILARHPELSSREDIGVDADTARRVEQWIRENNLNEYGDPKDRSYAGGNPLFGTGLSRYEYILARHPELQAAAALA